MTVIDYFNELIDITNAVEVENHDDVIAFLESRIAQEQAKKVNQKKRDVKKRENTVTLTAFVAQFLSDSHKTRDEVLADIQKSSATAEGIDIAKLTPAMVGSRLSELVKQGLAEKETISLGSKKITVYWKAYK